MSRITYIYIQNDLKKPQVSIYLQRACGAVGTLSHISPCEFSDTQSFHGKFFECNMYTHSK
jgi:hypothetical protein